MVLSRHNLPQPTQAQLMRGELPETRCIEQGVVLSCRFAESKVRWTSRMLWMAVVSQSSVKLSRRNSVSSSVGSKPFSKKYIIFILNCLTIAGHMFSRIQGYCPENRDQ